MSRVSDRARSTMPSRMSWAEGDLDNLERQMNERLAALQADVDAVKRYMLGILITLIGVLGALVANLVGAR